MDLADLKACKDKIKTRTEIVNIRLSVPDRRIGRRLDRKMGDESEEKIYELLMEIKEILQEIKESLETVEEEPDFKL